MERRVGVRRVRAHAHGSAPAPAPPHAGASLPPDRWGRIAGVAVVVVAAVLAAWMALGVHVVGDYYAESDFYGGYADGARLIRQGHVDPARYPVVGPGFDAAVAAASLAVRDRYTAAKLVSVASAIGALALWLALLTRRLGPWAAAWSVTFLAAIPVFGRYAYSASTDMLCAFLQAACAFALLGSSAPWGPAAAGVLAALATLTRYNSAVLLPAGIVCLAFASPTGRRRGLAVAAFVVGFLVVAGPWWGYSMAAGQVPGAVLFQKFGFYAAQDATRNVQDLPAPLAHEYESIVDVVRRDPAGFVGRILKAFPEHLRGDAREVLGWPAAACALVGLVALAVERAGAALAPVGLLGAGVFASLLLAFYSERYSMPLAPFYLALVGGLATAGMARRLGRVGWLAAWTLMGVALVATAAWSVDTQRQALFQMPVEVIPAGRAIAAEARPGDRVISRKGHIGYYAGLETVSFPRVKTLQELGDHARRTGARFLYYSWYDGFIRPEFAYLLDSTATIPGLTPVYVTDTNPAAAFRVGPDFGTPPPWMSDPDERAVHQSRGLVRVLPEPMAWSHHIVIAAYAAAHDRWGEALGQARLATRSQPDSALGWSVVGEALRRLGRLDEAGRAYARAMALDPADADARVGLGWVELQSGHPDRAAEAWRPVADRTRDPEALAAMAELFERLGDQQSLGRVKRAQFALFGDIGTK
jgi:tetratricopeptide repeat protein/dolichyl-phosphate-mannose-protein mannosyltransferase